MSPAGAGEGVWTGLLVTGPPNPARGLGVGAAAEVGEEVGVVMDARGWVRGRPPRGAIFDRRNHSTQRPSSLGGSTQKRPQNQPVFGHFHPAPKTPGTTLVPARSRVAFRGLFQALRHTGEGRFTDTPPDPPRPGRVQHPACPRLPRRELGLASTGFAGRRSLALWSPATRWSAVAHPEHRPRMNPLLPISSAPSFA